MPRRPPPDLALVQRLRQAGLRPTRQRLAVAAVVLRRPCHRTAEEVVKALQSHAPNAQDATDLKASEAPQAAPVARATVYATLAQFARAGLLRELHTGAAVVYDSNPSLHPHWLDVDSGQVHDLPPGVQLRVDGLEGLPPELRIEDVQLMLRVRRA